jgi:hypothetical protein
MNLITNCSIRTDFRITLWVSLAFNLSSYRPRTNWEPVLVREIPKISQMIEHEQFPPKFTTWWKMSSLTPGNGKVGRPRFLEMTIPNASMWAEQHFDKACLPDTPKPATSLHQGCFDVDTAFFKCISPRFREDGSVRLRIGVVGKEKCRNRTATVAMNCLTFRLLQARIGGMRDRLHRLEGI